MNEALEKFKKQAQKISLYQLTPKQKILKERGKSEISYQCKIEEFQKLKEEGN